MKYLKRTIFLVCLQTCSQIPCPAQNIHLPTIAMIESSGGKHLFGDNGNSLGHYQIQASVVADYNKANGTKYRHKDMLIKKYADRVCHWRYNIYAPKYLKARGFKDTIKNRIICYNASYAYRVLTGKKKMAKVTKLYVEKYLKLARVK